MHDSNEFGINYINLCANILHLLNDNEKAFCDDDRLDGIKRASEKWTVVNVSGIVMFDRVRSLSLCGCCWCLSLL